MSVGTELYTLLFVVFRYWNVHKAVYGQPEFPELYLLLSVGFWLYWTLHISVCVLSAIIEIYI